MKYLFYLLVVVNLVFFTWKVAQDQRETYLRDMADQHIDYQGDSSAGAPEATDDQMLSAEPGSAEDLSENAADEVASTQMEASSSGCYEIGPLQDRDIAEGYANLLLPSAKGVRLSIRAGDVPDGWWLIYPKASTLEAAHANRRMLENNGIHETWLFDKGPLQGAISLGLYKTRAEADKAQQLLVEKGVGVRVSPRMVRGEVLWLKIPWTGSPLGLEETVQMLNSQDPSLNMPAPTPCN